MGLPHRPHACLVQLSKFVLVLALGIGLAGCFTSYDPLIAANASDHPLTIGARFTDALNCASVSFGCESRNGYRPMSTGSIEMERGQYVLNFDPGSNLALSLRQLRERTSPACCSRASARMSMSSNWTLGPSMQPPGTMRRRAIFMR